MLWIIKLIIMKYLKQLGIILAISFIAEVLKFFIPLPIPAGIYGMIILFLLLCTKIIKPENISDTGNYLISVMGVMFVPAGVGIMNNFGVIYSMLGAIIISVAMITIAVMFVSGKVTEFFIKKEEE